jgi:hypothetical protein
MAMNYETDSVSNLEKYGVVQFIKGCQFTSRLENGVVKRRQDIAYERDGKYPPYVFPNWEIDGFVDDPIEWGDTKSDGSRHNFYWNHEPSHNRPSVKWDYFGFKKPSTPELWLRDGAVIAAYSPESGDARNVSLEMKTCIYKTSDVPRSVPYDQVDFATPIYCFNWTKSVIFNFKTMQYDSPEGIDPFCESFDESSGVTVKK